MFSRLFAQSGLSLDRLRALVEVGAAGGIVRAAGGDPVRQSQFSRQIKDLEDFFQTRLVERQGKGVRLTGQGRELARISRFFLLGLSNFQRGRAGEPQTFRIGGPPTFLTEWVVKALGDPRMPKEGVCFETEAVFSEEVERRLHDLTLDFAIIGHSELSRPLQVDRLAGFELKLCVPKSLGGSAAEASAQWTNGCLPLARATRELAELCSPLASKGRAQVVCSSFGEARRWVELGRLAAFLPDFLVRQLKKEDVMTLEVLSAEEAGCAAYLAWNPRLLRLNPQAVQARDQLLLTLQSVVAGLEGLPA
jgi:DNA-binding transcriptional LysR family regulator